MERELEKLPDEKYKNMDPGIRPVVRWLRDLGFDTRGSGDGKIRGCECDRNEPHVVIICDEQFGHEETRRLETALIARDVRIFAPMQDQDGQEWPESVDLEESYSPRGGGSYSMISLTGPGLVHFWKPAVELLVVS